MILWVLCIYMHQYGSPSKYHAYILKVQSLKYLIALVYIVNGMHTLL